MTSRHHSFVATRRPSSAIFIGLPPQPSPPSPAHSSSSTHSQLPSPPATNSGSTGDSSSASAGSIRRAGMPNGSKPSSLSDDDDNVLDHDEDDTAKLSDEKRSGKGKAADYNPSSSTLERVKSLTERNRKVIDKLSSITSPDSHSRSSLSTPSAPSSSSSRSRSPLPPTFSSSSSSTASTSSRVSFAVSPRGGSGSETEREQQHPDRVRPSSRDIRSHSSAAVDPSVPPGPARQHTPVYEHNEPRQRLRSAPSSPAKLPAGLTPNTPRKHTSTTFAVIGSGRRSRRVSIQQPDADDEDLLGQPQTTGGSGNKKSRAPLPREFRDRRSLDGRSIGESSTSTQHSDHERTISPGVLIARGAASPHSSGAGGTFSATPTSPRAQRPARPSTMRDSSRRMQRWNSVDEVALNGNGISLSGDDPDGRRQRRHAGSAESPLGGREGRSVVGEGLRAAGLAPRGSEDVFAEVVPQRRTRLSGGLGSRSSPNGSRDGDLDELRYGIARVGPGTSEQQDPRTPPPAFGSVRYGTARNIHSILSSSSSRASTSLGSYGPDEEGPPAPLRPYRPSYVLPERTTSRHTPQHERSHTSPYGRGMQHSQTPSSEHARLMLDSLAMFEAQLARIPTLSTAPDLSRVANSVVHSANGLNTLLRAGNAHALEAQIEAEVGDAAAQVDASEVWRQVGGEYRESLRVSDELVRTVTALLLGVGRLMRESVKERGTESPDFTTGGGVGGRGRSSLDEGERPVKPGRRSIEVDGRRSIEGSVYRESRRSWEDTEGSVRRAAVARAELNSRPSTSLSMTRDRDRDRDRELTKDDGGEETARERERSSVLDRLSIRRMFTPRAIHTSPASQDSPDLDYPSPSPALRTSLDRDRDHTSIDRDRHLGDLHHSLPSSAVPPPLPSLPSESVDRKGSTRRRAKVSNTSNATVRGTLIFPAVHSPGPTTAVSAHTVSAAGEVTAFPLTRAEASSGSALVGLQEQQERDVRKRRISITAGGSEERGTSKSPSTRVLRSSRVRMSLDGTAREEEEPPPSLPPPVNGERRERRRTINDLPS